MSSSQLVSASKSLIFSLFILINAGWLSGCCPPGYTRHQVPGQGWTCVPYRNVEFHDAGAQNIKLQPKRCVVGLKYDPLGMSTTITPTNTTYPASLTEPTTGDPVQSTQLRVDNAQKLLNATEAARFGLYGGGTKRRVVCTANNSVKILPLGGVFVTVATVWTMLQHSTTTTFDPTNGGAVVLTANTRYWVYASISAGVIVFNASTTVPNDGLAYSSADTDHLWISTFYVDHANNILPYTQTELDFKYTTRTAVGGGARGNLLLDSGTATADTNVSFLASLPFALGASNLVTAKSWKIDIILTLNTGGPSNVYNVDAASASTVNAIASADVAGRWTTLAEEGYTIDHLSYSVNGAGDSTIIWLKGFTL